MLDSRDLDPEAFSYLQPDDPRPGQFYLLPKIHKEGIPGRPIVSAIGHHTEKISEFLGLSPPSSRGETSILP